MGVGVGVGVDDGDDDHDATYGQLCFAIEPAHAVPIKFGRASEIRFGPSGWWQQKHEAWHTFSKVAGDGE